MNLHRVALVDPLELAAQEVDDAAARIDRCAAEIARRLTPDELAELDPRFSQALIWKGGSPDNDSND